MGLKARLGSRSSPQNASPARTSKCAATHPKTEGIDSEARAAATRKKINSTSSNGFGNRRRICQATKLIDDPPTEESPRMNLSLRTKGMARYSLGSFGQRNCRISFVCCASDRLVAGPDGPRSAQLP